MVKWNEKQASLQTQNLKTAVIKLASLEKRQAKNDQEIVYLKGEGKDEVFSNFMSVWRKQGISLESLNYGDELLVRWKPSSGSNGFVYKNFVEVFQKKRTTLQDLDHWDPEEEEARVEMYEQGVVKPGKVEIDMSSWETGDSL